MSVELIIGIITLLVAIAAFVVSWLAYRYTRNSDRKRVKDELARKEAILRRMNDRFFTMGMEYTVAERMRVEKSLLEVEIEELKKQL